ncbi:D-arabinose 1-dehydrogenase [NAD(P)+]-like protein [Diaporthe sp. PMI_573]|nr:D-arabinose 1-dehydrogenase [NAD(P)+]-like protein [Diaporthaceae sp. PMI_573]
MGSTGSPAPTRLPISSVLPPLILGTATFNTQYVDDPSQMPYKSIVSRALELGVNAFDTSPYYGPSEILLGDALHHATLPNSANTKIVDSDSQKHPRDSYMILTKAGRISGNNFDYSPSWIRYSVLRSLKRLHTPYLDLVYCHDVEFVSPAEVLAAVKELRRLRDEDGVIRYVGISGYPVDVLCDLAEMIYRETGEGVDAVMSYCHCSVQNHRLVEGFMEDEDDGSQPATNGNAVNNLPPLVRLKNAGVSTVLNASMLGMGLLTTRGVDHGPQAAWHPSPSPLRKACADMAAQATAEGERLERLSIRWALDTWARAGARSGLGVSLKGKGRHESLSDSNSIGGSVMGITTLAELEETWGVWLSVLAESVPDVKLGGEEDDIAREASQDRCDQVRSLVRDKLWPLLGEWRNHSWPSGLEEPGFRNERRPEDIGTVPLDDGIIAEYEARM